MTTHRSPITGYDADLFMAGRHYRMYEKLGAHPGTPDGRDGVWFAVWAPNAEAVSVIGDFNGWAQGQHPLHPRQDGSGIWEGFIGALHKGVLYKYHITGPHGYTAEKSDPYAFYRETPPRTASVVYDPAFTWNDTAWMEQRRQRHILSRPLAIYEVHLGSWRRNEQGTPLSYLELAAILPGYCHYMGFTHVEFLPVMEHPFYGSWGYQTTGYFAPSSRYGTPEDFMTLVDSLHQAGIGVILDWVPSHFPTDEHGPGYFDGTHLYEHADPRKGFHPDWKSFIFNYSRHEVQCFLISNALFWLDKYHIDGLRVDAVASMLYLDYSRNAGEWMPNEHGGRENLEAIHFLKSFNDAVHQYYPDVFTIAEESTAWPGVTLPTDAGGLGFDLKWMMGWMNDTLRYFEKDPVYRSHHHGELSFSIHYAFSERFCLPLSHDEVVHGKRSLISKMPGDEWQQFANLRLLYSYMYGHPGAKLLFMGGEFGQLHEWRHDHSLDWHENQPPSQQGLQQLLRMLNELYRTEAAMYTYSYSGEGFEWIDFQDTHNCVLAWMRKTNDPGDTLIFVANFTPVPRLNYRVGAAAGRYRELFNSDDTRYGGSGMVNGTKEAFPIALHGRTFSLSLTLPPLGLIILKTVP